MQRDKRGIESVLLSKGFEKDERHHHFFLYRTKDGRLSSIRTKTSHTAGMKSIGAPLLGHMARQCGLLKSQFMDLVDCPLSRDDYEALLKNGGHI